MQITESNLKNLKGWNGTYPIFNSDVSIKEIKLFMVPESGLVFEAIKIKNVVTGQTAWMSPPSVPTPPQTWRKVANG